MKRSEMVAIINEYIVEKSGDCDGEELLTYITRFGIQPPLVKSERVKGVGFPFGMGCSMRCNCEDCNPNFLVNEWEPE